MGIGLVASCQKLGIILVIKCTANPNTVRLTGNSLSVNSHREHPVLIEGALFSLLGFPPVGDCSVTQKLMLSKNVNDKKYAPRLLFEKDYDDF